MKNLDPMSWIARVKEHFQKETLESFRLDESTFLVPSDYIGFTDVEDEIYPEGLPYSTKKYDIDEFSSEEDTGDFDFSSEFEANILPEIVNVADAASKLIGAGEFEVEFDSPHAAANVDFIFTQDDVSVLQEKGIIPQQPNLAAVLASAEPTFSDFEGPLFEQAKVDVAMKVNPDGRSLPDPATAKLVLPNISTADSERVQKEFQITVKQEFEDETALVKTYQFTFLVKDMSFEPLADGKVRPRFKAELKEYRNA